MGELQALHPAASSPTMCRIHPEPGPPTDSVSYPETCFLPHQKWMPWVPCPLVTSLLASAPFSPPHCLCPRPGLHPSSLDHDNSLTGQHPHLTATCLPSDPSQRRPGPMLGHLQQRSRCCRRWLKTFLSTLLHVVGRIVTPKRCIEVVTLSLQPLNAPLSEVFADVKFR